jgi:hypothetical protein
MVNGERRLEEEFWLKLLDLHDFNKNILRIIDSLAMPS